MKRVYQTDFTNETGNCLQACVASRLNLHLVQVPHFKELNRKEPVRPLREWLNERGYSLVEVSVLWDVTPNVVCLAAVESKAHPGKHHVVVAKTDRNGKVKLLHDPNKKGRRKVGKRLNWIRLYFIFNGSRYIKKV